MSLTTRTPFKPPGPRTKVLSKATRDRWVAECVKLVELPVDGDYEPVNTQRMLARRVWNTWIAGGTPKAICGGRQHRT